VPTDVYLGGTVYTRYGSFHLATSGQKENYYYSIRGKSVTDDQQVPFQLPKGVSWPFGVIKAYFPQKKASFLYGRYIPLAVLKADMKGSVRKAVKVGRWWRLQLDECVLKEGKQFMAADQWGRTIYDRLHWQYQLHQLLQGTGMIPEVYDFFTANGAAHLAMQYIEGPKLQQRVFAIYSGQSWFDLSVEKKMALLNYLEQIVNVVVTCHDKGIIHRDLNPDNFLVDKTNQLWCIDFELAYSEKWQQPSPAFGVGTIGYMSPEQQRQDIPTVKEDIYAFGALMITVLTGLPPTHFAVTNKDSLFDSLYFFIRDTTISRLISSCLDTRPQERPLLEDIKKQIALFKERQQAGFPPLNGQAPSPPVSNQLMTDGTALIFDKDLCRKVILQAIQMLSSPVFTSADFIWLSKATGNIKLVANEETVLLPVTGLYTGIAGILYVIAQVKAAGFDISGLQKMIDQNFSYLQNALTENTGISETGLYEGTAGIAYMLSSCLDSQVLLPGTATFTTLKKCCSITNTGSRSFDVSRGLAGQGLALLAAKNYLPEAEVKQQLQQLTSAIISGQQKDGSWIYQSYYNRPFKYTGYATGVAGTVYFLLTCFEWSKDPQVKKTAIKGLTWLENQAIRQNGMITWPLYRHAKVVEPSFNDGITGILLAFIKGYEVLGEERYRDIIQRGLSGFPEHPVSPNLTLTYGLPGIGLVYLEAFRVFHEIQWLDRAAWIAGHILHNRLHTKEGGCYWLTDFTNQPVAGYMTGHSGILLFLARFYQQVTLLSTNLNNEI
jgi:serine/threonine protein kinase